MAKDTINFTIEIPHLRQLLRELSRMPKDLQGRLRDKSGEIAKRTADKILAAADREGDQARMAARSVLVRRDRVPAIAAGGSKILARRGRQAVRGQDVFFGSEFGGARRRTTMQFEPHRGTEGYWFFPTIREEHDEMVQAWGEAVDEVAGDWMGFSGGDD